MQRNDQTRGETEMLVNSEMNAAINEQIGHEFAAMLQ
jgi:hypothetical protein